jgi:hypothetical protein
MFLPSHFIATVGRYTYRHTDSWKGFMKYAVEMGSGAIIRIPSFITISPAIEQLMGDSQTAW